MTHQHQPRASTSFREGRFRVSRRVFTSKSSCVLESKWPLSKVSVFKLSTSPIYLWTLDEGTPYHAWLYEWSIRHRNFASEDSSQISSFQEGSPSWLGEWVTWFAYSDVSFTWTKYLRFIEGVFLHDKPSCDKIKLRWSKQSSVTGCNLFTPPACSLSHGGVVAPYLLIVLSLIEILLGEVVFITGNLSSRGGYRSQVDGKAIERWLRLS